MRASGRRWLVQILSAFLVLADVRLATAYLKFGLTVDDRAISVKWAQPTVPYYVTDTGVSGVSAADFRAAIARAFATWEAVPTSSIAYQFVAPTSNLPGEDDGRNTLGFLNEPSLDRVLGATSFLLNIRTGALIETDIFFNSSFPWSVSTSGQPGRFDLESIAVHEIGHMSGLGHSAIGETEQVPGGRRVLAAEAVMFPIAFPSGDVSDRRLRPDDIAGISDLYPAGGFEEDTGTISGTITKNGGGVFGAHVVAADIRTGELVGNFTLATGGAFVIAGLRPGPYLLRVEPVDDADLDSFFDDSDPSDIDFRVTYHNRLLVVPRGGDTGSTEIKVVAK